MPSPGSLRRLRARATGKPHSVDQCDRELERLADLACAVKPRYRTDILRRLDVWLDERLRAMRHNGEMNHAEDRAHTPEWGPLG